MKKILFVLFVFLIGCGHDHSPILGKWSVESNFYSATYNIVEIGNRIKCEVLYYNDGTSSYKKDAGSPYYLSENLQYKNGIYIDGVSGATTKMSEQKINITLIHKDTLNVTTYIMNKPLIEHWIKTN